MKTSNHKSTNSRPTVHTDVPVGHAFSGEVGHSAEKQAKLDKTMKVARRVGLAALVVATGVAGTKFLSDVGSNHEGSNASSAQSMNHPVIEASSATGVSEELNQQAGAALRQELIDDHTPRFSYVVQNGDSPASIVEKSHTVWTAKDGDGTIEVVQPVNDTVQYKASVDYLKLQAETQPNRQLVEGQVVILPFQEMITGESTAVQPRPDGLYTPLQETLQSGNQD